MKIVMRDIFLKQMKISKNVFNFHCDLPFLLERNKIKKCNKLVCNVHDKEACSHKNFKINIKSWINI